MKIICFLFALLSFASINSMITKPTKYQDPLVSSNNQNSPKIHLLYWEAGGGHKSAAVALRNLMQSTKNWNISLVNVNTVLSSLDAAKKIFGVSIEDSYNIMLRKDWTGLAVYLLPVLRIIIKYYNDQFVKLFEAYWTENPADMVVSLIPHINKTLFEAYKRIKPDGKYITILTDLADIEPHIWFENQDQYFICGSEKAKEQAEKFNISPKKIFQVSGMIVKQEFYENIFINKQAARESLGLKPNITTVLLFFGGEGSESIIPIAKQLAALSFTLQLIIITGKNEQLAQKIKELKIPIAHNIQGFTHEIPKLMAISDIIIGKPGPGTISEALVMQLPMITMCNGSTLPQEKFNAEWLNNNKFGIVIDEWQNVGRAVEYLLAPNIFKECKKAIESYKNGGIFEVQSVLSEILKADNS